MIRMELKYEWNMRKCLSFFFAIFISVAVLAQSSGGHVVRKVHNSVQERTIVFDGMKYMIRGNVATLIKGKDALTISIPRNIVYNGRDITVTAIGSKAFEECKSITSVTIPSSVHTIGSYAFWFLKGITSITLPSSVKNIGKWAFYGCSGLISINIPKGITKINDSVFGLCEGLKSVTIPNSVTSIDEGAFASCKSLVSVSIPNSVRSIGPYVFQNCENLISLTIPSSVRYIGWGFSGCKSLKYLKVEAGNTKYDSRNNCNAIIETATNKLILGSLNTVIPNNVKIIGNYSFSHCKNLSAIDIPNGITTIGDGAFLGCSRLTSITIPKSVRTVGSAAFMDCTGLKKVIVKDIAAWCSIEFGRYDSNPMNIAGHIFSDENAEITDFVIPDGVTKIGTYVFINYKSLSSISIPKSVKKIASDNFYGCKGLNYIKVAAENMNYDSRNNCNAIIEKATNKLVLGCKNTKIPNGITTIGPSAFSGCNELHSITIPNSVTCIEQSAFSGCNLSSLVIPNSVTCIKQFAFSGCNLTSLVIPNSVITIGQYAFEKCKLSSLSIPNSVREIGYGAFDGCILDQIRIPSHTKLYSSNGLQQVFPSKVKIIRY